MTIKHLGGVFGRNPTFYNVTIEGQLTFEGNLDINSDITWEDNKKALFGDDGDLQIYHDATLGQSRIQDVGTGSLYLQGDGGVVITNSAGTSTSATFASTGATSLSFNGGTKFATTSTGVDVTGTATMDALTVSNSSGATLNINTAGGATDAKILLHETATATSEYGASLKYSGAFNRFEIGAGQDPETKRLSIDRDTGDISFYEDTGTTAKMFWDASAESLGIGTSSPSATLEVVSSSSGGAPVFSASGTDHVSAIVGTAGGGFSTATGNYFSIWHQPYADRGTQNNLTERMRVDSDGHLIVPQGVTLGTAVGTYAAANTLDDYEEGLYTVAVTAGTSGTITLDSSQDQAQYTKVGRKVTVSGRVTVSSVSSPTGTLSVSVPFALASLSDNAEIAIGTWGSSGVNYTASNIVSVVAYLGFGSTFQIYQITDNAGWSALDATYVSATDVLAFNITYVAA